MALPEMTIASRNIGDIFYTLRRDDTLNGAVPCDGREFNASDFDMDDPTNNPYSLCINGKIPNVDYTQYAAQLRSQGCCACFGIDVVNGKFKVPTIKDVYIRAGDVNTLTTYLAPGLPNITGGPIYADNRQDVNSSAGALRVTGITGGGFDWKGGARNFRNIYFDASQSNGIYGRCPNTVQPPSLVLRPMTQLLTAVAGKKEEEDTPVVPDQPSITLKIPYIFVPGTEAKATEVNTNFEYVLRAIEGIAPSAAAVVHLEGDETISGKKTFLTSVSTPAIELIPSKSDTHGGYIDFHYNGAGVDYTARLIEAEKGFLSVMKSPSSSDSSTKLATTEWVNAAIASKGISINSMFPNYSTLFGIGSGYRTVVPGWVRWTADNNDHSAVGLYINGVQVGRHGQFKYGDPYTIMYPVPANSTITFDSPSTAAFCKCIGS